MTQTQFRAPCRTIPSPAQFSTFVNREHADQSQTHRYAGGIAKIRLIKRMAKQLSPRLSPKTVGPRVPVENLVVTKKNTESNLLVNSTASEGIRYYARHDANIRREP